MAGNFVGRKAIQEQVLGTAVEPGRSGSFSVVSGIPGTGKSEFLNQLERRVAKGEKTARGTIIWVRGSEFEVLGSPPGTREFDKAAEFRQLKALLREALREALPGKVPGASDPDAPDETEVLPGLGGRPRVREQTRDPAQAIEDAAQVIEDAARALTQLARNLAEQHERLLLLVDDFHLLAGRPLGDWVLQWLTSIRGTDIVVTHLRMPARPGPQWPSQAVPIQLGNLDRDDVARYLTAQDGIGPDVAKVVGPVWEFTGGHPQALVLVADLIRENPREAVRDIRRLHALDGGLATQLEVLVERLFRVIGDTGLRDALYGLCVTRHFDLALLMRLLDLDEEHAQTLIDQIRTFSFVTGSHDGRFLAIDDFVRRIGRANHVDWTRSQKIHAVAADYFHSLIADETASDESWAQAWSHLEDRRFQVLKKDWLHHLGHLTGRYRRLGRLEIARIFLDGFWWWGCYVPFPFCEEILADWMSATSDDREDRSWGEALRMVYDSYPKGGRLEAAPRAKWVTVRRHLRYLWDQGGFAQDSDEPLQRHVRGLLDAFLADALRYLNPADPRADEHLDDAAAQLAGETGDYIVAWLGFARSELALQRGHREEAMALATRIAQAHAGLGDHELYANLHRVHADARWAGGEHALALDGYARAVAHGYRAQGLTHPDDYTIAFQREMTDRCLERMAALHADGGAAALAVLHAACGRIRAFFRPYWEETGADWAADVAPGVTQALAAGLRDEAASLLFPAGTPGAGPDLARLATEWELICRDVTAEMAGELARPPGVPLPPEAG